MKQNTSIVKLFPKNYTMLFVKLLEEVFAVSLAVLRCFSLFRSKELRPFSMENFIPPVSGSVSILAADCWIPVVNSSRVFSLGFVMGELSFLLMGKRKGPPFFGCPCGEFIWSYCVSLDKE